MIPIQDSTFRGDQLRNARVKAAYDDKEEVVKSYFKKHGLNYNGFSLFIRAFKKEMTLEAWVKERGKNTFKLLTTYDFCTTSGSSGPKRKEGDLQIPEGVYHINHFNPVSNFHLSLGINYPNASDKLLSDKKHPGGEIYIHGSCVTVGCIPITDDKIDELYILAVEAINNGQVDIPVYIFPARLDKSGMLDLRNEFLNHPKTLKFWEDLQIIFRDFERSSSLRLVRVTPEGRYTF